MYYKAPVALLKTSIFTHTVYIPRCHEAAMHFLHT